ncbi:hypothetical protein D1872_309900 [compost metagenome]
MHGINLSFPAIVKTLSEVSKNLGGVVIRIGPVRSGVKTTAEIGLAAIAEH